VQFNVTPAASSQYPISARETQLPVSILLIVRVAGLAFASAQIAFPRL
jgi:hypothetical protein